MGNFPRDPFAGESNDDDDQELNDLVIANEIAGLLENPDCTEHVQMMAHDIEMAERSKELEWLLKGINANLQN